MDSNNLRQLVCQPEEGAKLDFKIELYKIYEPKPTTPSDIQKWADAKEQQWAELVKDVLALANGNVGTATQIGYLIVGADDKLKPDGTPTLRDVGGIVPTRKEILEKVNSYCQPQLPDLQCEVILVDGIKLLVISIPPTPYLYRLSKQLKTPKKEYSPYTVLIRRGDGERTYEASPDEQKAIEQEKQTIHKQQPHKSGKQFEGLVFSSNSKLLTLKSLLESQNWQEADSETAQLIGGSPSPKIRDFPIETLNEIDEFWRYFSNNRFGFSAQRRALDYTFSGSSVTPETCLNEYQMANSMEEYHDRLSQRQQLFAENVGWHVQGDWVTKVDYGHNVIRSKPEGYLPVLGTHPQSLLGVYMLDNNKMLPCLWILLLHFKPWK
jgi:hypothetical protein